MHHEQDMRKMGGLRKYMPITFWTSLIGTLALVGTPFFAGFYSKDTIIEAAAEHAHEAHNWVATYGLLGPCCSAHSSPRFYSFRLLYLTFFGAPRWHDAARRLRRAEADSTSTKTRSRTNTRPITPMARRPPCARAA